MTVHQPQSRREAGNAHLDRHSRELIVFRCINSPLASRIKKPEVHASRTPIGLVNKRFVLQSSSKVLRTLLISHRPNQIIHYYLLLKADNNGLFGLVCVISEGSEEPCYWIAKRSVYLPAQ